MVESVKLPVIFDKCPNCGSTERLAETHMKQLKEEGYLSPEYPVGMIFQTPLVDQAKMQKTVLSSLTGMTKIKVIVEYFDTCASCGTVYCTSWNMIEQDAKLSVQQPAPPPPQFRQPGLHPFRGKGQRN